MNQREMDFLSLINMLSDSSKNRGIEPYKRTIINILNGNIKSTNAIVFSDLEIFGKYKNFNSPIFDLMVTKYSQYIRIDSSKKNQRFFFSQNLDSLYKTPRETNVNQQKYSDKTKELSKPIKNDPQNRHLVDKLLIINGALILMSIVFLFASILITWETGSYGSTGYRVGAICNDGTRSYSTGSGTCSWHGGVDYWIYSGGTSSTYEEHTLIEYTWPYQLIVVVIIIGIYYSISFIDKHKP